jgi:hypothetical protein
MSAGVRGARPSFGSATSPVFEPRVLEHPAFSVFEPLVLERLLALRRFPEPRELCGLTRGIASSIEPWFAFAEQDDARLQAAGGFDALIANSLHIPTRRALHHDLLGALIWLHFPALKTEIHRLQLVSGAGSRSPLQNAATHLDESGVLVVSSDSALFVALADLDWRGLFWDERERLLRTTRFLSFGHGLLDSLRAPHPRLMGKALCVHVSDAQLALGASALRVLVDREAAPRLAEFLSEPARLQPLPVLGVPAWSSGQTREFYEDERYFQRKRSRARPRVARPWLGLNR